MIHLTLRPEMPADYRAVETLTREAFWNHHGPGCDEHYLVHTLRTAPAFLPSLCTIAVAEGRLVGSIVYARATVELDRGGTLPVLTFGPLSVLPEVQRCGVGSALVRHTLALARESGHTAVFLYGDPAYYSRLGFQPAEHFGIGTADNRYHDALQACLLQPNALSGANGRFLEGEAYEMDPEAAAAFDAGFPPKAREYDTPTQRHFQALLGQHKPRL